MTGKEYGCIGLFVFSILAFLAIWMILVSIFFDYSKYKDWAANGVRGKGVIIDYEQQITRGRRGSKRISHYYPFVCDGMLMSLSRWEQAYKIGDEIQVFYSPKGEGCLVGVIEDQHPTWWRIMYLNTVMNSPCRQFKKPWPPPDR